MPAPNPVPAPMHRRPCGPRPRHSGIHALVRLALFATFATLTACQGEEPAPAVGTDGGVAARGGAAVAVATPRQPPARPRRAGTETAPAVQTPPTPAPPRRVTSEEPLRVHVAGDSFAEPVAVDLMRFGAEAGLLTVDLDFQLGSGVSRSDFFDWPARLTATAAMARPEVLVFNAGGNDPQPIWTPGGWIATGNPDWRREYARRAGAIMDAFGGPGIRVYWIGLPILRDPEKNLIARLINTAVAAEASGRPWVRFLDIWPLFVDPDGAYAEYLPGPDGKLILARQADGVHLSRQASRWVSDRLLEAVQADWDLPRGPQ